jgi:hypothetical protein
MKKLILILFVVFIGCNKPETVPKSKYLELTDSMESLILQIHENRSTILVMQDSINDLKLRPLMTSDQFMELYKYESLRKYYNICKKNPTQKKYYWGWTARIFEQ